MGRVYAGWGLSQTFYRAETYLKLGFASLEDFIVRDWQARFGHHDGNDLLAMIHTWQSADIGAVAALRRQSHEGARDVAGCAP